MQLIELNWPLPKGVRAVMTTREGGTSIAPYHSLNLGDHVGDDALHVQQNRERLQESLPGLSFQWLNQVHGTEVFERKTTDELEKPDADAIITRAPGAVCGVLTADCLPLLLCNSEGTQVAAVHAGWRGLLKGVIRETTAKFNCVPSQLSAFLGAAISQVHFEVGPEVKAAFEQKRHFRESMAFVPSANKGHWQCDLYQLARAELAEQGVAQCFGGDQCTFADELRYFSYRRDGRCGRQLTAIWIEP